MSKIFKEKFPSYVCMGDTVSAEFEGYTITATLYQDEDTTSPEDRQDGFWPSLDPKADGYIGNKSKRTLERQMAHAREVLETFARGDWSYCGLAVTVSRDELELTGKYAHAVWGCDYNYPTLYKRDKKTRNDYLMEYAEDLASEALDDAKKKLASLLNNAGI